MTYDARRSGKLGGAVREGQSGNPTRLSSTLSAAATLIALGFTIIPGYSITAATSAVLALTLWSSIGCGISSRYYAIGSEAKKGFVERPK